MKKTVSYDDVLLAPQYSGINSRAEINIGNFLDDDIYLDIPIISSPMDTVTEWEMAQAMAAVGGLGIIHRYNTPEAQAGLVRRASGEYFRGPLGAAVGVTGDYLQRANGLIDAGAEVICVDMAHGHHVLMERALKTLKDSFGDVIHLMAGNIATPDGCIALTEWGADSIRCGIGGGSICSTRIQTGHGIPTLQTVMDCAALDLNVRLIADGGLRTSGDIVKALAAGADFVMVGSLLGGTSESPGRVMKEGARQFKEYRGMASPEAKEAWRSDSSYAEGVSHRVLCSGSVREVIKDLGEGIASGFSYSGAVSISQLWHTAEFILQTSAGREESSTHIFNK